MQALVRDLNRLYRELPALHVHDCDPAGFEWLERRRRRQQRLSPSCATAAPATRRCSSSATSRPSCATDYRVGVPRAGALASSASTPTPALYGGSNVGNAGDGRRRNRRPGMAVRPRSRLTLPPLATIDLRARRIGACRIAWPSLRVEPGLPHPLGATWDGGGVNFALFSANAEKVELCLFDPRASARPHRIALPEYTHEVWHGYLPDVRPGQLYGYRVHGPYDPHERPPLQPEQAPDRPLRQGAARRDPLARRASSAIASAHRAATSRSTGATSAFVMPKCVVVDTAVTWGDDRPPRRAWADTIIYEAHVKGMTAAAPGHPRAAARHLRRARRPARHRPSGEARRHRGRADAGAGLLRRPLPGREEARRTTGATTPSASSRRRRATSRAARDVHEFKVMVRRLHEAGIEVILDVVYNHTAEGNQLGPTLSFRGIDNASYYMLGEDRALLFRHDRLRQHGQPAPSARAADGDGFAALLGGGVPRRRLPLRPRHLARPRIRHASTPTPSSSTRCARTRCCRASR